MEYGCIGEKLGHSFSKEIHTALGKYSYELCEVSKTDLDDFMSAKNFKAINVTIPYKEAVIPHLFSIDEAARKIGAVNTVVNRDGKLYGYNTDFYGMTELIRHAGVEVSSKKAAILGTGGTSKTAKAVLSHLGAKEIITVSRNKGIGTVDYEELYQSHSDTEIIINTTPLGMFPNVDSCPVDITKFPKLSGVIDAVYNPLRTSLICEAKSRAILAEGGLYMLVAQAIRAAEKFTGEEISNDVLENIFEKLKLSKENVVLIGMPASGKSTVGRILEKKLSRPFVDTDALIEERAGMTIPEYFEKFGESEFRRLESEVIHDVSALCGYVIATGGGAMLRGENVTNLKKNGKLFFIDRPLEALVPTEDRPLSRDREAIKRRYHERYEIYKSACDVHINAECSAEVVAERIVEKR